MKHWTLPFRHASAVTAIALVVSLSASCSETPFQPKPSAPPPPPPVSTAVLVLSDFTGRVGPLVRFPTQPGEREIDLLFTLTETGGRSGASVKKIRWTVDGVLSPHYVDEECWGFLFPPSRGLWVDPGATLNTFGTGWDNFAANTYYCAPGTSGVPPTQVGLIVTFADSHGVTGTVEATTFVE